MSDYVVSPQVDQLKIVIGTMQISYLLCYHVCYYKLVELFDLRTHRGLKQINKCGKSTLKSSILTSATQVVLVS